MVVVSIFDKVDHFHFVKKGEDAREAVLSVITENAETLFGSDYDTNSMYQAFVKTLSSPVVDEQDLIYCMNDLDFSLVITQL